MEKKMANIKCDGNIETTNIEVKGCLDFHADGSPNSDYNSRLLASGNKLNVVATEGLAVNNISVATKNDVNNVGKAIVELGVESNGDTITLSQPITNFKFIWIINYSTSEAFRCPFLFPAIWLSQHYGQEIQLESYDGSRYRCKFDNSTSFTIVAKYYANDVHIYGIN